ncbi:alpha/beta hydrolase family esterase [Xylanimonas sp. McL0601]|uniref:alpha/beta hydrolase family esterase n=1 Tax=Xylanimonas sp. McL0601 TaxID=3414739 RepID=UPI003CF799B8
MSSIRTVVRAFLAAALLAALAACSSGGPPPAAIQPGSSGSVALDDRPFTLAVPDGYDEDTPVPLVVGLHGYTGDGAGLVSYLGLGPQAQDKGFLLASPDGTKDSGGDRFWNATAACCDFNATGVDDSAYLSKLITTVEEQYTVDPDRVFVVGHSNGGFMALRMACEHADQVAAVVSVAGEMTDDASTCKPSKKVSVLQVQGDHDEVIHYDGGNGYTGAPYPGAETTVQDWRTLDGCGDAATPGASLDLEGTIAGAETTPKSWSSCTDGTEVALWTIAGGLHSPTWSPEFGPQLADWMLAHPRTS